MQQHYINNRGYVVIKSLLKDEDIEAIRKELTVTPKEVQGYGPKAESFPIYLEGPTKLYLPKYYGLQRFGIPNIDKINEGTSIDLKFSGSLRPQQQIPVDLVLNDIRNPTKQGSILSLSCGGGKCLAKGTKILMFDGTLQEVQDIVKGDKIMGDDSTPRNIISTTEGNESMFKIMLENGDHFICNGSHILSLVNTRQIIDISVNDYLMLSKFEKKALYSFKVPINFPTTSEYLDEDIAYDHGRYIFQNGKIPHKYKSGTILIRKQVLTGVLDYYGIYESKHNIHKVFVTTMEQINDILFIARSLGYLCYHRKLRASNFMCTIIAPKKLLFFSHQRDDTISMKPKKFKFKVIPVLSTHSSSNKYYGFEIDGNRRFVLGDFTVTHNTVCAINILCALQKKTLIVVHKEFLLQQWKERILEFTDGKARIGTIKARTIDVDDKDIVIGSLQSLSMKDYDPSIFDSFGNIIYDECLPFGEGVFIEDGQCIEIGVLYHMWKFGVGLPKVLSLNQTSNIFEYKSITHAWKKQNVQLLCISFTNMTSFRCTKNHQILTKSGYKEASSLLIGDVIRGYFSEILEIATIQYTINEAADICVFDIEVEDNHNFVCFSSGAVLHNCHHNSAKVFSRAMQKLNFKHTLGLTATPERKDGLTKVFKWHIGEISFKTKQQKGVDDVAVRMLDFESANDREYSKECYLYNSKPNISRMINNICECSERIDFAVKEIANVLISEPSRRLLVLSERKLHLVEMKRRLNDMGLVDTGLFFGGMKEKELKASEECQIMLATTQMTAEGFDKKGLDTLVLASPKSDVIQIVGRILRDKIEDRKNIPLIIDIVDNFSVFVSQANKRRTYYTKMKYSVSST